MTETAPWPLRSALLALLGAALGVAIAQLQLGPASRLDGAGIAGLVVLGLAFAHLWERGRLVSAAVGAALTGLVALGGTYAADLGSNGPDGWRLACALIAVAVALPLFQAFRDSGRDAAAGGPRLPYAQAHDRAWTGLVITLAALAFMLTSWLLAWLLAALFKLIGIKLLEMLLQKDHFAGGLLGAALGAGMGLARDQAGILSTLQRVLRFILAVLAPVLALGLALFLAALPFTGLAPLWQATKSTTPIMLLCGAGALVLANAIIADGAGDERRARALRWAAAALAAILPALVAIAGLSLGKRIDQHGLSPDRLWAAMFIAIAAGYALAYGWALLKPADWMARVRRGNLAMAFALCGLALLLATPLISFGGIATRDQLARLENGAVKPADFDWKALRFDFGADGVAALRALAKGSNPALALSAKTALAWTDHYDAQPIGQQGERAAEVRRLLLLTPQTRVVPEGVVALLAKAEQCGEDAAACLLHWPGGSADALVFQPQFADMRPKRFRLVSGQWQRLDDAVAVAVSDAHNRAWLQAALAAGKVSVRKVPADQLLVNGQPASSPDAAAGYQLPAPTPLPSNQAPKR